MRKRDLSKKTYAIFVDIYISFGSCSFRFFLGSNKVMQVALGRSASDEIRPGIFKVSKVCVLNCCCCFFGPCSFVSYIDTCCVILFQLLHGDAGLLVTDMPKEEVER